MLKEKDDYEDISMLTKKNNNKEIEANEIVQPLNQSTTSNSKYNMKELKEALSDHNDNKVTDRSLYSNEVDESDKDDGFDEEYETKKPIRKLNGNSIPFKKQKKYFF